jgi:hypothetical protein
MGKFANFALILARHSILSFRKSGSGIYVDKSMSFENNVHDWKELRIFKMEDYKEDNHPEETRSSEAGWLALILIVTILAFPILLPLSIILLVLFIVTLPVSFIVIMLVLFIENRTT